MPDLAAFEARRAAARAERDASRAAQAARFRALDAAARASLEKPKPSTGLVKKPGPNIPHVQPIKIVPCPKCGVPTRGRHVPEVRAPGTRIRRPDGLCRTCHTKGTDAEPRPARDLTAIIAEYVAGASLRALATKHHVSKTTIRDAVVAAGHPLHPYGGQWRKDGAA